MTRRDNDGGTVSTVMIHPELHAASVVVRMQVGYSRWALPSNAKLRKWVDEAIAESAYPSWKRQGRSKVTTTASGWYVYYELAD